MDAGKTLRRVRAGAVLAGEGKSMAAVRKRRISDPPAAPGDALPDGVEDGLAEFEVALKTAMLSAPGQTGRSSGGCCGR